MKHKLLLNRPSSFLSAQERPVITTLASSWGTAPQTPISSLSTLVLLLRPSTAQDAAPCARYAHYQLRNKDGMRLRAAKRSIFDRPSTKTVDKSVSEARALAVWERRSMLFPRLAGAHGQPAREQGAG